MPYAPILCPSHAASPTTIPFGYFVLLGCVSFAVVIFTHTLPFVTTVLPHVVIFPFIFFYQNKIIPWLIYSLVRISMQRICERLKKRCRWINWFIIDIPLEKALQASRLGFFNMQNVWQLPHTCHYLFKDKLYCLFFKFHVQSVFLISKNTHLHDFFFNFSSQTHQNAFLWCTK